MKATITITEGPGGTRTWTVEPNKAHTIGRSPTADFILPDTGVSRIHCEILSKNGQWLIADRESANGVEINGVKVKKSPLEHGDTVKLGSTIFKFEFLTVEASTKQPISTVADSDTQQIEALGAFKIIRIDEENTVKQFVERHPLDSSYKVLSLRQKLWYSAVVLALSYIMLKDYLYGLALVHLLCTFYLVVIGYKLTTVLLSAIKHWEIRVTDDEIMALNDEDLPVYTILVPLYKEIAVADKIAKHIEQLDYPKSKLDVKILLEPDDPDTLKALKHAFLPSYCEAIICPESLPKTKPKACNHGLARARGEFLVIYDAEDRPESDQLKKAVVAFRKADERWKRRAWMRKLNPFGNVNRHRTVCLQAKLNYYNPTQNILTRWFTIEYATWFHLYLPGLNALRAPIPLGGTSNHFRTSVLKEIGGWDPFNVTEDCDLGIRIHKLDHRTDVFDSTTWEEANSEVGNWLRQRSRWVKGYLQTHFTHMRHPFRTLVRLRPLGMFHFLNAVGGLALMLILNPIFWFVMLLYAGLFTADVANNGWSVEQAVGAEQALQDASRFSGGIEMDRTVRIPNRTRWAWPIICATRPYAMPDDASLADRLKMSVREDWKMSWLEAWNSPDHAHFWNRASQVFFVCTIALLLGNVFFVLMHVIACIRAKMPEMIPFALLMPFYWVLISVGAWMGFIQLFIKPFYWEKTLHGLDEAEVA